MQTPKIQESTYFDGLAYDRHLRASIGRFYSIWIQILQKRQKLLPAEAER